MPYGIAPCPAMPDFGLGPERHKTQFERFIFQTYPLEDVKCDMLIINKRSILYTTADC
jgi:hypothetical protein